MKLHTGRSRNDQIATDMRLWFKNNSKIFMDNISKLINAFLNRATFEIDVLLPGYTHLQVC
jgi:argininosuccinate lyase